jgi:hypothetical protein
VIGNPPYLNAVEKRTRFGDELKRYIRSNFKAARGTIDSSILFQELGVRLLSNGGRTSFIVPNKFLSAPFGEAFRKYALSEAELRVLADFSTIDVFDGVGVYPVVYVLEARSPRDRYEVELEIFESNRSTTFSLANSSSVSSTPSQLDTWSQIFSKGTELLDRLKATHPTVGKMYEVAASASASKAYEIKPCLVEGKPEEESFAFITSGAIDRYYCAHGARPIRYLKTTYSTPYLPRACSTLSENRKQQYSSEKLVFAGMTKRLEAIWDPGRVAGAVPTVQVFQTPLHQDRSLKYELGILNSKLIDWIFDQYFASLALAGGYLRIGVPQIKAIPIRVIDFSRAIDVAQRDHMIKLVERMLNLHEKLAEAKIESERTVVQHQIDATDRQIDRLVYELYDLTDEEIEIVEGS